MAIAAKYFGDITSANSESRMTIDELYPEGFPLEQFGTDQGIASEDVQLAESRMGVDGKLSAGYVCNVYPVTITFEPISSSVVYINDLKDAMNKSRRIYRVHLECRLPSLQLVYKFVNGHLENATAFPAIKKTLDPVTFKFVFESLRMEGI
jgi:hypothetical protein